jgi:hypothetical protein
MRMMPARTRRQGGLPTLPMAMRVEGLAFTRPPFLSPISVMKRPMPHGIASLSSRGIAATRRWRIPLTESRRKSAPL